jgi:hypothetical protein
MQTFLEWRSPEHHFDRKTIDWYWILGIVCLGAAVLAFYFDNILFGVFIIIAGITIGTLSYKETREIDIKITNKGVVFGNQLYPWTSYNFFWIDEEHPHGARILIHPVSQILPLVVIPISEEIDLNELRDILDNFLTEEYIQESIFHKWFDQLLAR